MISLAPAGATINSIISVAQALEQPIRPTRAPTTTFLGFGGAAKLGVQCLGGARSEQEVLRVHTLAPVVLALLDAEAAEETAVRMLTCHDLPTNSLRDFGISPVVRRCPECVRDDVSKYGFAYARVVHQFRPVVACPAHGVSLEENCRGCAQPFALLHPRGYRSMDHGRHVICSCQECGSDAGVPLPANKSQGAQSFVHLLLEALRGSTPLLRPSKRFHLIAHAAEVARERQLGVEGAFLKLWGSDSIEDAAVAACIRPTELKNAFSGAKAPYAPYSVLSIVSFAMHILSEAGVEYVGDFSPMPDRGRIDSGVAIDAFANRVREMADEIGLAQQAAQLLAKGCSINTIRSYGHSEARLRHFLEKLNPETVREIKRRQERRRKGLPVCSQVKTLTKTVQRRKLLALVATLKSESIHGKKAKSLRTLLHAKDLPLYNWMQRHDRAWFDQHVPSSVSTRRRTVPELTVESARKWIIDSGVKTIPELRLRSPKLFQWLLTNDQAWLRRSVPAGSPLRAKDLTQGQVRAVVITAADCGARSVNAVCRYASAAKKLAMKHDAAWFQKVIAVLSHPMALEGDFTKSEFMPRTGLQWARQIIQLAITSGLANDASLRAHAPNAYLLVDEADRSWLEKMQAAGGNHGEAALWTMFFTHLDAVDLTS